MFIKALRGFSLAIMVILWASVVQAAPYAALVMDARTGEVLHSRNADTRLHPASLTKMMTLYVVFREIEAGRMNLDQIITISRNAANEPPSKLGLKSGQRIALRYLIRAAAVKSANDAATALGEAVAGSEAKFARLMTQTAHAMGMTSTTFKNAHGLTANGHMSTARDMGTLGRRLFYDFPEYYNLFSRISTETTVRTVYNTNRRFLRAYRGADGIKTGFTNAAGFNLVASAERGSERVIAVMFGGTSTAQRNGQVAKLLDMGFERSPTRAAVILPPRLNMTAAGTRVARTSGAVRRTDRPVMRGAASTLTAVQLASATQNESDNLDEMVSAVVADLQSTVNDAQTEATIAAILNPASRAETPDTVDNIVLASASPQPTTPMRRAKNLKPSAAMAASVVATPARLVMPVQEMGDWSVQIGTYRNRVNTEKLLLQTALMDLDALQGALRKVEVTQVEGVTMYRAQFVGLSQSDAAKACARLNARDSTCDIISPNS